jgi:steroid delta-isomerase-like uncharacterized protein
MADDAKTVVQRYMDELWNNGNPAAADEILAADLVWIHPTLGNGQGRQAAMGFIKEMRDAFPDMQGTIRSLVAEGDRVTAHWEATGSHRGPFRGAAPTGQRVTWEGVTLYRVVDGRIVEHRAFPNTTPPGNPHQIAQSR